MSKVKLNRQSFMEMLRGISQLTPRAKFEFGEDGCRISANIQMDGKNIRAYYHDPKSTATTPTSFCADTVQMFKVLKVVFEIEKDSADISPTVTKGQVSYVKRGGARFKINTLSELVIENCIAQPIKVAYEASATIPTSSKMVKTFIALSGLSEETAKVYLKIEDDKVIAELDDKKTKANSVGYPINTEKPTGKDWGVVAVQPETFKTFANIDSVDVNIGLVLSNKMNFIEVLINGVEGLTLKIIAGLAKG